MPGVQKTMTRTTTSASTCKGRCARAKRNCAHCSRTCKVKLSWPCVNDGRRSIVSKTPPVTPTAEISDARFVHTSHWDVELYHSLTNAAPVRTLSFLDSPVLWNPSELEALDRDLLENFCFAASASLSTFGQDASSLGNILVRMVLEGGETASATALFQAIMAFSSLHRYGLQSQAVELKIAALGSLAEGSFGALNAQEAILHIATGMLLCSFELHQASSTSGQWMQYLSGVKTVINASSIETLLQYSPDTAVLLDWVHYHDVLARFTLLHWKGKDAAKFPSTPTDLFSFPISMLSPQYHTMLNLLSQVCDAVSAIPPESKDNVDDHKGFLGVLDWRIRSLPLPKEVSDDDDYEVLVMKVYQLAMLLYLARSSDGLIDQPIRTQQHMDQAFAIFPRLSSCKHQFPIYVIGCEARTDEQRAVILDVIDRTEKMGASRSLSYCKTLLQAIWAQDDLAEWNNISYREKLTSVMSHYAVAPAFV